MKCALVKAKMCYDAEISCYITFTQNTVFSPTDRDCFFVKKTSQEYGVRPRQSRNALRCRDFVLYNIHSKRLLFGLTDRDYFFFQKKEVKSMELLWGPSRHLGSLTAATWVSFDFNVSYSSCWGYSLINTLKLKKKWNTPSSKRKCATVPMFRRKWWMSSAIWCKYSGSSHRDTTKEHCSRDSNLLGQSESASRRTSEWGSWHSGG